jgi:hypothetical protein
MYALVAIAMVVYGLATAFALWRVRWSSIGAVEKRGTK